MFRRVGKGKDEGLGRRCDGSIRPDECVSVGEGERVAVGGIDCSVLSAWRHVSHDCGRSKGVDLLAESARILSGRAGSLLTV